jgi:SAM-dependent methyltransferase
VQQPDRIERERAYHDDRYVEETRASAAKYYSVTAASYRRFRSRLDELPSGSLALELGCGVDETALDLARRGVHVEAIDISSVAIEKVDAAARAVGVSDHLRARTMNAEALEHPDATFDAVFGTGILHHLDLDAVFACLARVVKTDGFAVFIEPLGLNPLVNAYRRLTPGMRTPDEHPLVTAVFALASRFFAAVSVSYFHTSTLLAVPFRRSAAFPRLLGSLERVDRKLFDVAPRLAPYVAWQCVIALQSPRPQPSPAR